MLGADGLTAATKMAILNANYLAARLRIILKFYNTGETGRVAHEMILDCHHFKLTYGVDTSDVGRRMMDYGYHAPTVSFPVHESLMVEPTESESMQELDRFVEMMIAIKGELEDIKTVKPIKPTTSLPMPPILLLRLLPMSGTMLIPGNRLFHRFHG